MYSVRMYVCDGPTFVNLMSMPGSLVFLCLCRIKNLFCPLRPEEGVTAEAFRLLYPQVIKDIKVCVEHGVSTRAEEWG